MLCSGCVGFFMNIRNANRRTAALKHFKIDRFASPSTWANKMIAAMARVALARGAGQEPIEGDALGRLAGATPAPDDAPAPDMLTMSATTTPAKAKGKG